MQIGIKWFPPAWVQIVAGDTILYIDPAYLRTYFLHYPKRIEYSRWPDPIDGLPEELPPADIILVTHHHKDHVKRVTVDRLRKRETVILAPTLCKQELGENIVTIAAGESLQSHGMTITAVEAYNTPEGSSAKKNHRKGKGVGYVLGIKGKSIYHAGDTDLIPEMKSLGRIDLAFLPIGGTYTMDRAEAIRASRLIKPEYVIPIHQLNEDPHEFKEELEKNNKAKAKILNIGEEFKL